jgi:hypothetical protein
MAYSHNSFSHSENHGAGPMERAFRVPRDRRSSLRNHVEPRKQLTGRDLADIVRLLECKLAWYGFRSVKVGPFIRIQGHRVFIDLLDRGEVLCRMELDAQSDVLDCSRGHALALLVNSLQEREASRRAHSWDYPAP